jgi:hypothetical protein
MMFPTNASLSLMMYFFVLLGLANLRPRLAVARKVEADDYSSEETLKVRLMTACKERGFYFN